MGRTSKKKDKHRQTKKGGGPSNVSKHNDTVNEHYNKQPKTLSGVDDDSGCGDEHRAIYAKYKQATRSFRDGLSKIIPKSIPLKSVSDLGNAVEYLLNESEQANHRCHPPNIGIGLLSQLNTSIKLREEIITKFTEGNADEGHSYMNGMLRYCQDVLRKCRKIYVSAAQDDKSKSSNNNVKMAYGSEAGDAISDRFGALKVDDDREEEQNDEGDGEDDHAPVERPSVPDREYSIEKDLIEGNDRIHAMMYMYHMNMLLDLIDYHIGHLRAKLENIKSTPNIPGIGHSSMESARVFATTTLVMACSECLNLALDEMKYLDISLKAECPQLKSFYHVVATLVFPNQVKQLEGCIQPSVLKKNPHMALDFIAEALHFGFRTPVHPEFFNSDQRSKLFAKNGKLSSEDSILPVSMSWLIQGVTFLEVGPDFVMEHEALQTQVELCRGVYDTFRKEFGTGTIKMMWGVLSVGRNRIIEAEEGCCGLEKVRTLLRTQSMLQCQLHSVSKLEPSQFIDPSKYKASCPLNKIRAQKIDDPQMVEWFLRTVYPINCNQAIRNTVRVSSTQRQPQLEQHFTDYVRNGDAPVQYTFTLAVYATLTGALQLQCDLERISQMCRDTCDRFYRQVKWAIDQEGNSEDANDILENVKGGKPAFLTSVYNDELPEDVKLHALWQPPLSAGWKLSLTVYKNNMHRGFQMLDWGGQMQTILHLYHALRKRGLLQKGDIQLLDDCDSIFATSKAIWGEGKPNDNLCRNFFVAIGYPVDASKRISELIKTLPSPKQFQDMFDNASEKKKARAEELRRSNITMEKDFNIDRMKLILSLRGYFRRGTRQEDRRIEPTDVSNSYRFVMLRDFSGLENDASLGNSVGNCWYRQEALQKKVVEEAHKMSLNYPKLGWLLNDALIKLGKHMNWEGILSSPVLLDMIQGTEEGKRILILDTLIGDRLFGELDFDTDSGKYGESKRCASYLKFYFHSIRDEDIRFF